MEAQVGPDVDPASAPSARIVSRKLQRLHSRRCMDAALTFAKVRSHSKGKLPCILWAHQLEEFRHSMYSSKVGLSGTTDVVHTSSLSGSYSTLVGKLVPALCVTAELVANSLRESHYTRVRIFVPTLGGSLQSPVAAFYDESHSTTVGQFAPTLSAPEELVSSVSQSTVVGKFILSPATQGCIVKENPSFVFLVEEAEIEYGHMGDQLKYATADPLDLQELVLPWRSCPALESNEAEVAAASNATSYEDSEESVPLDCTFPHLGSMTMSLASGCMDSDSDSTPGSTPRDCTDYAGKQVGTDRSWTHVALQGMHAHAKFKWLLVADFRAVSAALKVYCKSWSLIFPANFQENVNGVDFPSAFFYNCVILFYRSAG